MTFNEGMRIDTSTTSTGGGAGRGIAIGGGFGGLAIVLLALFLGVDPGPVMSQQQVKKHGIKLDPFGIPTVESLSDWHRKNNPQLFVDEEEGSDGTE